MYDVYMCMINEWTEICRAWYEQKGLLARRGMVKEYDVGLCLHKQLIDEFYTSVLL